ncbi:complement receptor type 2-like [Synchiropus picturatus]
MSCSLPLVASFLPPVLGRRTGEMMATLSWTLMLLCLTLLDAARDRSQCSPPPLSPKTKLSHKRKFTDGDKVSYLCAHGNGATPRVGWLQCRKGKWRKLTSNCDEAQTSCSPPKVTNSVKSEGSPTVYRVGQSAIITCSPGFQLDGPQKKITCNRSGQWQPQPPRCRLSPTTDKHQAAKEGGCAAPRDVLDPNIHIAERHATRETFDHNERVQFVCSVGYAPAGGSRFRWCVDGKWTPLLLQCERRLCGSAGEIPYGQFAYTGVQFGDTATASCDDGYRMVGQATRRCLDFGWDGRVPVCEAVQCDKPPVVANAQHDGAPEPPYMYRTVVRYHCSVGVIVGSQDVWCTKDGTWSSTPQF